MQNVMGLINLNDSQEFLKELTRSRPLAAVPFAGRYRLIDFILSNMVNSGIENIGVLVSDKYKALMNHLRSGKEWDLARKKDGLFILPPGQSRKCTENFYSNLEKFYNNLDYIESSKQKYVLIAGSHIICNLNYSKVFQFHQEKAADITVMYKEAHTEENLIPHSILQCQSDGRIMDLSFSGSQEGIHKVSMEMYLMERTLLVHLIKKCYASGGMDFVKDVLMKQIHTLAMYGYPYRGYSARIDCVKNYYKHSMELLKPEKWEELFFKEGLVYTKVQDEAPVKYKENAQVLNTMVGNGCVIEGRVENSILFSGVNVQKGAHVKDSIIMQKCDIGENVIVEHIICDKNVSISHGKRLKGEKNYPLVVAKGSVI